VKTGQSVSPAGNFTNSDIDGALTIVLSSSCVRQLEQKLARKKSPTPEEEMVELLRNMLIIQLGMAKVPQNDIRKIAGCGINRINDVLKHIPKSNR
jgi:hypothetical protein